MTTEKMCNFLQHKQCDSFNWKLCVKRHFIEISYIPNQSNLTNHSANADDDSHSDADADPDSDQHADADKGHQDVFGRLFFRWHDYFKMKSKSM